MNKLKSPFVPGPARGRRRITVALAALLLPNLLAGCWQYYHNDERYVPVAHTERHPIAVSAAQQRLDIVPSRGRRGLDPSDHGRVAAFAADFQSSGSGPLIVARPTGGRNEVGAAAAVASIQKVLLHAGVPDGAVSYRKYPARGRAAPVVLTYDSFEAIAPPCGRWDENIANNYANRPYPDFGCASQNNLAAMVADPHDLVAPRGMTPRDAQRRDVVIDSYRKGEVTATEKSSDESGVVSEVEGAE